MSTAFRTVSLLLAVTVGWLAAKLFGIDDAASSTVYVFAINALLGFGLYASTRGIELSEFRQHWGTVLIAVTLGVLAKVALVFGFLYLFYRRPEHLLLAVAVAQIDPLSVAAMRARSRLSESAKTLLAAWASFDDPITVLLTTYLTVLVLGTGDTALLGAGLGSFALNFALNLALAAAAFLLWRLSTRLRPVSATASFRRAATRTGVVVVVLGVGLVAVHFSLLLALALIGLFYRPGLNRDLDRAAQIALYAGTFAIGLVLVNGIDLATGAMLGLAAFLAQAVVAAILTTRPRWRGDRTRLALGQQNGLTAIILALLLEPQLPGAAAIIAPAIVVVNLLHALTNTLYDNWRPLPTAEESDDRLPESPTSTDEPLSGRQEAAVRWFPTLRRA
ncbi:cation:proton antiporter [Actinokineospora iranica]|uniref:NhaP-type Na+/H+ or K+/H+ antiporter n=1 Tax=Actinokineospora iranica TaxID=1271860 RepID=A0A1G6WP34_9PSEU|nr:hypothetical protein [Actinokineospora iranica]SDD66856.1 hypothetical protein SAMN05216174_11577 [Actinokineospora iranica]